MRIRFLASVVVAAPRVLRPRRRIRRASISRRQRRSDMSHRRLDLGSRSSAMERRCIRTASGGRAPVRAIPASSIAGMKSSRRWPARVTDDNPVGSEHDGDVLLLRSSTTAAWPRRLGRRDVDARLPTVTLGGVSTGSKVRGLACLDERRRRRHGSGVKLGVSWLRAETLTSGIALRTSAARRRRASRTRFNTRRLGRLRALITRRPATYNASR